jgi:putative Ca2+/H+ antiporter (TMEM165/GDT1 family)
MQLPFRQKKDVYSGLAMVLLGLFAAHVASGYDIGTIRRMGPGFLPIWLGIILAVVGFLITISALRSESQTSSDEWRLPDPRGSICIIAGLMVFIASAGRVGLVPSSLALIFISAMGDREQTLKSAALLAIGVTLFGVVVFSYALSLPFPLFTWTI